MIRDINYFVLYKVSSLSYVQFTIQFVLERICLCLFPIPFSSYDPFIEAVFFVVSSQVKFSPLLKFRCLLCSLVVSVEASGQSWSC